MLQGLAIPLCPSDNEVFIDTTKCCGVCDLEITCIARDIDLYAGTAQLAALDMDRKQTTIRKSSMHQQFVWRCRLDLFSRLRNGDLWKLIGGERREAGRLSYYREEHRKEMAPKNRDDAHEVLDRQAPTDGIRTDLAERSEE